MGNKSCPVPGAGMINRTEPSFELCIISRDPSGMVSDAQIEMKIKEFKAWVNLPAYDSILEALIRNSYAQNIGLSLYDKDWSTCSATTLPDGRRVFYLWIKKEPRFGSKREVLFDIIHESGHAHDDVDRPLPGTRDRDPVAERGRELRAWAYADEQFGAFPDLADARPEYEAYKRGCLATYSAPG